MAAVPLFRDTDIATVTSRENALIMNSIPLRSARIFPSSSETKAKNYTSTPIHRVSNLP